MVLWRRDFRIGTKNFKSSNSQSQVNSLTSSWLVVHPTDWNLQFTFMPFYMGFIINVWFIIHLKFFWWSLWWLSSYCQSCANNALCKCSRVSFTMGFLSFHRSQWLSFTLGLQCLCCIGFAMSSQWVCSIVGTSGQSPAVRLQGTRLSKYTNTNTRSQIQKYKYKLAIV